MFDFILCVGDDKTDEDMFRRLAKTDEAYTIKVGSEASRATRKLHNPAIVHLLLQRLAQEARVPA